GSRLYRRRRSWNRRHTRFQVVQLAVDIERGRGWFGAEPDRPVLVGYAADAEPAARVLPVFVDLVAAAHGVEQVHELFSQPLVGLEISWCVTEPDVAVGRECHPV